MKKEGLGMYRWLSGFLALTLIPVTFAEEVPHDAGVNEKLQTIIASWRERQRTVHSLRCSAKVESFFPKGYVSSDPLVEIERLGPRDRPLAPHVDTHVVDEPTSWEIDFLKQRVRIEKRITVPYLYEDSYGLHSRYELVLVSNGKSQVFHLRANQEQTSTAKGSFDPDVTLYESASHAFVFDFAALPLFWSAGAVSGQYPLPRNLRYLEDAKNCSVHGYAKRRGHNCIVFTVPEQNSPAAVREFWVGVSKPYPIYFCRVRDGDKLAGQIEIEYSQKEGSFPTVERWRLTSYRPGDTKWFITRTYRVEHMEFNLPLAPERFQKRLEPEMLVFDVKKNKALVVSTEGNLIPYSPGQAPTRWPLWMWLTAAFGSLLLLVLLWRQIRSYRQRPTA
jgi:hypothetical protein